MSLISSAGILTLCAVSGLAQQKYDILIRGGHVIDPKNGIDRVLDIAVRDGKIARIASGIPGAEALRVIEVKGLYVVPGLIDIHAHVFAGGGVRDSFAGGDFSITPDGLSLRSGVTTVVDAGSSGWRNFAEFKNASLIGISTIPWRECSRC